MFRTLCFAVAGMLGLVCVTSVAQAQELDVQASLEPFYSEGGFEHGRLVLHIHNDTGTPIHGIQVRLDGSVLDLGGSRVMQLDRLDEDAVGMVTQTYSTGSDFAGSLLPVRISYSGPDGSREVRLASLASKMELGGQ